MREIQASEIRDAIVNLIYEASYAIGSDIEAAVRRGIALETNPASRNVLEQIAESYAIAREERIAICQDTGMAVFFIEVGQEAHINGPFEDAVNEAVRIAYRDGFLRKSVVDDPMFDRVNTKDNTPAVIHTRLVPGDKIHILFTAKGFGSENMSRIRMFPPAAGVEGMKRFVIETVAEAGPNPCPPVIVGVGVGGTFEQAAMLAKRMTARPVGSRNPDPRYAALEEELLGAINRLGVGPAGIGGATTALAVNIDYRPTHIAGMPVAVNMCCHCARHAETTL
ncbi:MAG: fumarate hydratase [Clostridia bacterium]|nr:fumarate hydratase [Clostridia bacterium]MBO4884904.1 fumarate hydratase [Clostridia bacterium]